MRKNFKDVELLYFSIHNLSRQKYSIMPQEIDVQQIPYHDIRNAIKKTNSITRLSGAAASAGVIASPSIVMATNCFPIIGTPAIVIVPFLCAAATVPIIAIPFGCVCLAYGIKSIVMNRRVSKDITAKIIHKKITIKPSSTYEGLIFVKSSDYSPHFSMTLREKNQDNKIVFDVDLTEIDA